MQKDSIFAALKTTEVNGFLAQLVEQRIENPCVPGSIPGETTNHLQQCRWFFYAVFFARRDMKAAMFKSCEMCLYLTFFKVAEVRPKSRLTPRHKWNRR